MLKNKKIGIAVACALALGAWSGSTLATPVSVGGIHWDTSSPFDLRFDTLNLNESQVAVPGDVLTGYGQVGSINQSGNFCVVAGCNLTFQFNYTVTSIGPNGSGALQAIFDLGTINFFVSQPGTYDATNPASAGYGTPWLTLTGHTGAQTGFTGTGELFSNISGPDASQPAANSTGNGYLDATGGAAANYFHTATKSDGNGGMTDFTFSSSFQFVIPDGCGGVVSPDPTSYCHYPIGGTADLRGDSRVAVPEPGAIGLLGLGLGFLGLFTWLRRKETDERA